MHVDFLLVKQWGFKFLKTSSITKWFLLQVNSNLRAWFIRMHSVSKLSYLTFSIKRLIVIFTFNIKFILFLIFENIFIFLIFFTLQKLILFLIKIKALKTNFFGRNSIIDIVLRFLGIYCLEGWRVCCLDFIWFSLEVIIKFINITINLSHIIGITHFLVDKLFLLFLWQIVLTQIVFLI